MSLDAHLNIWALSGKLFRAWIKAITREKKTENDCMFASKNHWPDL